MIYAQLFHNGVTCDPRRSRTNIKPLFRNRLGRLREVSVNEGIDIMEADGWVSQGQRQVGQDIFIVFAKETEQ